ncbi:hypothetical protein BDF20DRAFT_834170 [Mycotypha africana]|uniref:uncharacterized protein n=1 Tax=Mycotypha africana TaxID=64632 RepID=UPI0023013158|nr:uncharacterized protein BDF20DRAFT_834170 [Mycotypha africana]KAI8984684.1 hypothetical protein BDF20DRAFT_834170 [Mycotypha africana]
MQRLFELREIICVLCSYCSNTIPNTIFICISLMPLSSLLFDEMRHWSSCEGKTNYVACLLNSLLAFIVNMIAGDANVSGLFQLTHNTPSKTMVRKNYPISSNNSLLEPRLILALRMEIRPSIVMNMSLIEIRK